MRVQVIPVIPENAPFTAEQRYWLNGYLAGFFSQSLEAPAKVEESAKKVRVVLVWGSQSGNAQTLCEELGEKLSAAGFDSPALGMEDFSKIDLQKEDHLLVVTSTWGDGDPPDNAVEFWEKLSSDDHPRLAHLKFAVLGLGDSNYLDFCGMAKRFDARLESLGARRLVPRVDCDVDFEEAAGEWFSAVSAALRAPVETAAKIETSAASVWSRKNPFGASLLVNRRLNALSAERDTRHFEISLEGSGLDYQVGDVLGVFAQNCGTYVQELIEALGCDGEEAVKDPQGNEVSLRIALRDHYAITAPSPKLLSAFCEAPAGKRLAELLQVENKQASGDYLWGREIIDLLLEFPGIAPSAQEFVGLLNKLVPRLYSISSSPKAHPGQVHLTVARVAYESRGRFRKGVASTWLADRVAIGDQVPVFLQEAKHFKLPHDPATPVIMVGPGTGVAPFRAFLEERRAIGATGKNWLFFGNPHRQTDFLYEDELSGMAAEGFLTRLDTAWSRDQATKVYVQDLMRQKAHELWRWLEEGAHLYVCGDAKRMAKDVDMALQEAISQAGGLTQEQTDAYLARLKKDKRYQRDVY